MTEEDFNECKELALKLADTIPIKIAFDKLMLSISMLVSSVSNAKI